MTQYYAAYNGPLGTGSGLSAGNAMALATAVAALGPGDYLDLGNGTYTSTGSAVLHVTDKVGTSESDRITIRATNEGSVLLNGESARPASWVYDSSYVSVVGINGALGGGTEGHIFYVSAPATRINNKLVRCVAWDATAGSTVILYRQQYALVEDCAAFGRARYVFHHYYSDSCTFRRCWGRWSGSYVNTGPKATYKVSYNSSNGLFENCIAEWNYVSGANNNAYGHWSMGEEFYPPVTGGTARIYGSMALLKADDSFNAGYLFFSDNPATKQIDIQHTVAANLQAGTSIYPFYLQGVGPATADHITSLRGAGGTRDIYVEAASWTVTNHLQQDSVGSYNLYTNTGDGATIRYRYVDGTLTATELFPWPMKQRILDALNSTVTISGTAYDSDYDLDTTIQGIFGTYPEAPVEPDPAAVPVCRVFPGGTITDYLTIPANTAYVVNTTVTWMAIVKPTDTQPTWGGIVIAIGSDSARGSSFGIDSDGDIFITKESTSTVLGGTAATRTATNRWYGIMGTVGTGASAFLVRYDFLTDVVTDAEEVADTAAMAAATATDTGHVGNALNPDANNAFEGRIHRICFLNSTITAAQFRVWCRTGVLPEGITAWGDWLIQGNSPEVDLSSTGNDMVVTAGTTTAYEVPSFPTGFGLLTGGAG